MSVIKLFPTQVWQNKLKISPSDNSQLLKECYAFREIDEAGQLWSKKNYVKGYTSYGSITDLHLRSPSFADLKKLLDKEVQNYCKVLELDLRGRKIEISKIWINIMKEDTYHAFHIHPLSVISGTYYVKVPAKAGQFRVEDPRIVCFMGSTPRKNNASLENQRYVNLSPKERSVLLFESWLKHEVPPNRSKQERISISFNYE